MPRRVQGFESPGLFGGRFESAFFDILHVPDGEAGLTLTTVQNGPWELAATWDHGTETPQPEYNMIVLHDVVVA